MKKKYYMHFKIPDSIYNVLWIELMLYYIEYLLQETCKNKECPSILGLTLFSNIPLVR